MTPETAFLLNFLKLQTEAFCKLGRSTFKDPSAKNVHALRVTVRRLRAAVWLCEHGSPRLSFGKLPNALRKLGKSLGAKRELDVALKDASNFHIRTADIKSDRKMAKKTVQFQINRKHRQKIFLNLKKAIQKLKDHPELNLNPGLIKLKDQLNFWVRLSEIKNEDLHELRVAAKKVRYALEAVGKPAPPLKKLQSLLGRGHDFEMLQNFTGKNPNIQNQAISKYKEAKPILKPTLLFAIKQLAPQNLTLPNTP